jgi:hypothetical protein
MRNYPALLSMLLTLLPISVIAEQFDLVCTWSPGTLPPEDLTLHVDTDRNTVNGNPAQITDAEIRYESGDLQGRALVTTINRYTGSMNVNWSGPARPYDSSGRGTCVKPARRQF